jgi:dTDP-4-amino-4,6-dideoxygalactose transaminase
MKIPICKPFFGREEAEAVAGVLKSGWVVKVLAQE